MTSLRIFSLDASLSKLFCNLKRILHARLIPAGLFTGATEQRGGHQPGKRGGGHALSAVRVGQGAAAAGRPRLEPSA